MSWIGNNVLNSPFSTFTAQPPETFLGQGAAGAANPGAAARGSSDAMIVGFPGAGALPGAAGSAGSGNGLSALMSSFAAYVNGLFNQIASWYGNGSGSPAPAGPGNPAQCGTPFASRNEAYFQNASASSWGDPHDTFSGTNASGQSVNGSWDNMHSHADLLDSDSFAGGYRISTQVSPANAQGVTMNQSAAITTDNGKTVVSLNASGQYQVSSNGSNVTLQPGQTAQLSGGESVTLNGDGSLTVSDVDASGGRISTTLKTNGNGGVDVSAQASGVDLGGYLVTRGDETGPQPVGPGFSPQPQPPIWRPHPDAAHAQPVQSPFDQIDQITN